MMTEKRFNPNEWIEKKETYHPKVSQSQGIHNKNEKDIEVVTRRVENARLDLTCSYTDWINIGFALADEFGESGREYFHRLSRFHSSYKASICDKQYDRCMKGSKKGITIRTFYYMAKYAGINIRV